MTPPAPTPPIPHGPLARWLLHPGQVTHQLLHHLAHVALTVLLIVGPPLAGVTLLAAVLLIWARHLNQATKAAGARLVHVEIPPDVDRDGAEMFWTNLVALLRPRWQRLTGNTHHVAFELHADQAQIDIAVWVPDAVPPGFVESAVEAAWPGSRTRTEPDTRTGPSSAIAVPAAATSALGVRLPSSRRETVGGPLPYGHEGRASWLTSSPWPNATAHRAARHRRLCRGAAAGCARATGEVR